MVIAEAAAAFVAWFGASVIVLADGRRGVALGLALTAAGLAFLAWPSAGVGAAIVIAAGGLLGAVVRNRSGPAGWVIMPAGSTPRLILCVAAALVSLWIAASVTSGDGAALRFAVLCVVVQMGGRLFTTRDPSITLAAVAALALAVADTVAIGPNSSGVAPFIVAALVAAGVMFVRLPASNAA